MPDEYRWIVGVNSGRLRVGYMREVTTDGPNPDKAIVKALKRITEADNDLWMCNQLTLTVERVR